MSNKNKTAKTAKTAKTEKTEKTEKTAGSRLYAPVTGKAVKDKGGNRKVFVTAHGPVTVKPPGFKGDSTTLHALKSTDMYTYDGTKIKVYYTPDDREEIDTYVVDDDGTQYAVCKLAPASKGPMAREDYVANPKRAAHWVGSKGFTRKYKAIPEYPLVFTQP